MSMPMDLYKKPPPDKSIINRIIKAGGQPLPGMVPSSSVPESDQQSGGDELTVQGNTVDCMEWWLSEEPWKELEHPNAEEDDAKAVTQEAENLKRAFYVFDRLLCERETILQDHIKVLHEVVDIPDKEVKTACITWATVVALGLAAAVGGVIFGGAALEAVAVVVLGAAALRISATIINKIYITKKVTKKLETVLKEHSTYIEEIERCVKFIGSKIKRLKICNLSTSKWVSVTGVVQVAGDSVGAIGPLSNSSGLIQGFGLGIGISFIKDDSEKLKQHTEHKFAKQIRMLAKQMQGNLDELMKFKNLVVESAHV